MRGNVVWRINLEERGKEEAGCASRKSKRGKQAHVRGVRRRQKRHMGATRQEVVDQLFFKRMALFFKIVFAIIVRIEFAEEELPGRARGLDELEDGLRRR